MFSIEQIPFFYREGAEKTAAALDGLEDVLIAAHVNLDGDALGSMGATGWILQKMGKKFALYAPCGVPEKLNFLPLPAPVFTNICDLPFLPKSAICLDCSEPYRLGPDLAEKIASLPAVNIDHHQGSNGMGSICNYICPQAAATAQLVAYVAIALRFPLEGSMGECLGLGIMTDTGGFCHGNTTAEVFELCAILSRQGCDFASLRESLQHTWTIERLRLWGALFKEASPELDGQVVLSVLTQAELAKFHCGPDDAEGIADWLRRLRKAKITAIMREEAPNEFKFSLRSFGEDDVRAIASIMGGGGHRNAAGGMIFAPLKEAKKILLGAIAAHFSAQEK